jgi:sulfite reductase (ferredoxin)
MASSWKEALQGRLPEHLANEIDIFEGQIGLRKQGKLDERVFAETRLRRGCYGQRYDNGQRHDGIRTQELKYPSDSPTKGPETLWDAPGMQRIKIPFGGLSPAQLEVLSELADEYSDGILHVTTRQDFQLHYVHIEDTPDLMRRLAAVNITTREACGNSVRNVTCCPLAGICQGETFDVTPYARAMAYFLLGHPDTQDFGRKFKTAFSGCKEQACGLTNMHDLGLISRTRTTGGTEKRGFEVYVGGGLGSVPHEAKLLYPFVPEEQILPLAQSIARVFARLGEKKNRNRARIKFLVARLGIDEFRRLVEEERKTLPPDPRWTSYLGELEAWSERPARPSVALNGHQRPAGFNEWHQTNVYRQRQHGYAAVTVTLPLGDLSSAQTRKLADLARKYCGDGSTQGPAYLRTTVEQNILLRWVPEGELPALYPELKAAGLGDPGAGTIVDVVACPGTDTCKLGIASSRGLAGELRSRLSARSASLDEAIKNLRIKISGCFNACGQHHLADLGFYGNSRSSDGYNVPHFQVVLGGKWTDNGGAYGLAMGSVPSKAIPEVVEALTGRYVKERQRGESFQDWIRRLGKKEIRTLLEPFMKIPPYRERPGFYTDWSDPRAFTIGDMGTGECAGEVVSLFKMEIAQAESEAFESGLALEAGEFEKADQRAYRAMVMAARSLVRTQYLDVGDDPRRIVEEFRKRFYDSKLFFDKYAAGKFAQYLFIRHEGRPERLGADECRRLVEEAHLFIDAAYACEARLAAGSQGLVTGGPGSPSPPAS